MHFSIYRQTTAPQTSLYPKITRHVAAIKILIKHFPMEKKYNVLFATKIHHTTA